MYPRNVFKHKTLVTSYSSANIWFVRVFLLLTLDL